MISHEADGSVLDPKRPYYADVIVPLPLPQYYTYLVPSHWQRLPQAGMRVLVSFGRQKILTALVVRTHQSAPEHYQPKPLLECLDDHPSINRFQLELFEWMAHYYMCTPGEVLQAALPGGLKISMQSWVSLHPQFAQQPSPLSPEEEQLVALLKQAPQQYETLAQKLKNKNLYNCLQSLQQRAIVQVYETVRERYRPKLVRKIRLLPTFADREKLNQLLEELERRAPQQWYALLKYLEVSGVLRQWNRNQSGVTRQQLLQDKRIRAGALKALVDKGIFEEFEEQVSRLAEWSSPTKASLPQLSPAQQVAFDDISAQFSRHGKEVVLLHGVTGSGKTEIYIRLIEQALEGGAQVLYLLPEIALTTQIVQRLRKVFGNRMGVYHSRFSDNERVEVWQGVSKGQFPFVVGVRSSVFLPFDNLSLIIIDEEHEPSYKQQEPAPRYHARDVALMLARYHHAKVLLGSATPSIESYHHAREGRYGYVTLTQRYGDAQLPQIELSDLRTARRKNKMHYSFSYELAEAIKYCLQQQQQVILFQNRRGYAPYLQCHECGWIPRCRFCNVSLTYHLYDRSLRCHYCGHQQGTQGNCQACGSIHVKTMGLGTEKVEDELRLLFPHARIARMDLDTTRGKDAYQNLIDRFAQHDIDILVGTQMITKGLDFEKVALVGILDADQLLYFPDFRAHERAFQLMTQVAGRAGRKSYPGRVIIQTRHPEHPVLHHIQQQDYATMVATELAERQQYAYPPFVRLIRLQLQHTQEDITHQAAHELVELLQARLGKARVLGPDTPLVDRVRNQYLRHVLVKVERKGIQLVQVKNYIHSCCQQLLIQRTFRRLNIVIDVDPV